MQKSLIVKKKSDDLTPIIHVQEDQRNKFGEFPGTLIISDQKLTRDAIKAIFLSYSYRSGFTAGSVSENYSLRVLLRSRVNEIVQIAHISFIQFRALHCAVFSSVSNGRHRITLDHYMDVFLPQFAECLKQEMNLNDFDVTFLHRAIIYPLLDDSNKKLCGLKNQIIRSYILCHRWLLTGRYEAKISKKQKSN